MLSIGTGFRRLDFFASRPWLLRAALLGVFFSIFVGSDKFLVSDANYSMLLSENLIRHRSFELDAYFPDEEKPYQIRRVEEHLFYLYPPGTSILSIPFVAVFNALGLSAVDEHGRPYSWGERKIQKFLAPLLMALFTVLVYEIARAKLPPRWSLVCATVTALGTPVWSTASRSMWSHTWLLMLIGATAYLLVANAAGRVRLRGWLLGSLLAWAYFTRPTASIPIVILGIFLLVNHRRCLPGYVSALAGWGIGFVIFSWYNFGSLLPPYYLRATSRLGSDTFWEALAANIISPSRGLLVFVPQLLVVAYLLARYRSRLEHRDLLVASLSILIAHWLTVSSFSPWWGNFCYGPRFMTDVVPWMAVLGILALDAWLRTDRRAATSGLRFGGALVAFVVLVAMVFNGAAGISRRSKEWYHTPVSVNRDPSRLWDWRDPPFLAWTRPRPSVEPRSGAEGPGAE